LPGPADATGGADPQTSIVGGRPGIVFQFAQPQESDPCHVLFYHQPLPAHDLSAVYGKRAAGHGSAAHQRLHHGYNVDQASYGASSDSSDDDGAVVPRHPSSPRSPRSAPGLASQSPTGILRDSLYRRSHGVALPHHVPSSYSRPRPAPRPHHAADGGATERIVGGKQSNPGGKKRCLSCGTNKTPYWRDGWDNVTLCNACGIRFQKYHVKCNHCLYIPRKDEKHLPNCVRCSAPMPL
jgi:hypothetical protein